MEFPVLPPEINS
ncbi:hypothetical protein LDE71_18305, partial [Mycobacterium tuberculosis]